MYWFVSVAFTPVDNPDVPLTPEEWRQRACMHVLRTDAFGVERLHIVISDLGFRTIDLEEWDDAEIYSSRFPSPGPEKLAMGEDDVE